MILNYIIILFLVLVTNKDELPPERPIPAIVVNEEPTLAQVLKRPRDHYPLLAAEKRPRFTLPDESI